MPADYDRLRHKEEMRPADIDFDQSPTQGPATVGFDYSYILPASLDMPPYCYLENQKLIEKPTPIQTATSSIGLHRSVLREGSMAPSFDFYGVLPTFVQKAVGFLRQQSAAKPFFLYIPFAAPHTPWVPSKNYLGTSRSGEYGDFVQQVDAAVGQVLHTLDSLKLADNTLVIFTSDNGPYWRETFVRQFGHKAAGPFRGMKGDAFEGGHRIPFIVRWPGMVRPGTMSNATTTLANLLATCAEIVGAKEAAYKAGDSYSILPVLTGKARQVPRHPPWCIAHPSGILPSGRATGS